MNRSPLLLLLLAFALAACGDQASQTDAATPIAEPTATEQATATPEPTDEPAATDDGSGAGSDTALEDLIPDELNGVARTDIPGMDGIIAGALQQQGLDASDAEFVFTSYGSDDAAVILTAFRIPGVPDDVMQQLGPLMSGAAGQEGVEFEQTTVGGKDVLRMSLSGQGQEGTFYMYFAEGAAFTIIAQDAASAEQLLAELP